MPFGSEEAYVFRNFTEREAAVDVRVPILLGTFQARVMHKDPAGLEHRLQKRELAP